MYAGGMLAMLFGPWEDFGAPPLCHTAVPIRVRIARCCGVVTRWVVVPVVLILAIRCAEYVPIGGLTGLCIGAALSVWMPWAKKLVNMTQSGRSWIQSGWSKIYGEMHASISETAFPKQPVSVAEFPTLVHMKSVSSPQKSVLREYSIPESRIPNGATLCAIVVCGELFRVMTFFVEPLRYVAAWFFLWRSDLIPLRRGKLLEAATARLLLQSAPGGYQFMHQELMSHLAAPSAWSDSQ
jgi:hypothetical protein